jgi:hypothetical protein
MSLLQAPGTRSSPATGKAGRNLSSRSRRYVLVASVFVLVVAAALAIAWRIHARTAEGREVRQIAADWQRGGLLASDQYVQLRAIQSDIQDKGRITDSALDELLRTMTTSSKPTVRARVLGVLSIIREPTDQQKVKISSAIAPMLDGTDDLAKRYARRVQKNLRL